MFGPFPLLYFVRTQLIFLSSESCESEESYCCRACGGLESIDFAAFCTARVAFNKRVFDSFNTRTVTWTLFMSTDFLNVKEPRKKQHCAPHKLKHHIAHFTYVESARHTKLYPQQIHSILTVFHFSNQTNILVVLHRWKSLDPILSYPILSYRSSWNYFFPPLVISSSWPHCRRWHESLLMLMTIPVRFALRCYVLERIELIKLNQFSKLSLSLSLTHTHTNAFDINVYMLYSLSLSLSQIYKYILRFFFWLYWKRRMSWSEWDYWPLESCSRMCWLSSLSS